MLPGYVRSGGTAARKKPQMFTQLMGALISANFHIFQIISIFCVSAVEGATTTTATVVDGLLHTSNFTAAALRANIDVDKHWTAEALIVQQRYPAEVHQIVTQDGYVLTLQRLPQPGHQPVLLVHGLYGSAMDFVVMGKNVSLAFQLWDQHYDVWLANCRGSTRSQDHTHYSTKDLLYWNFSFHEIGLYDLPAMLDYIRSNTSFHQLHYLGHSQGATALLVLAALRPEYQENLALVQLLAPLAFLKHIRVDKEHIKLISDFLQNSSSRRVREFLQRGFFEKFNCLKNKLLKISCLQMIFQMVGPDLSEVEESQLQLLFHQMPSGGSVKQLRHLLQMHTAGAFQHYNYGYEGNWDKYAAARPPSYNITKLNTPTVLYYGPNDYLATEEDVKALTQQLPRVLCLHRVQHEHFNHLDFIWAKHVNTLLNTHILQKFNRYAGHELGMNETA